jgi:S1-C subfamily serine protease/thioredoxin-related protein/DNA-directed RNA polymerase subunit RPC12/RpoP
MPVTCHCSACGATYQVGEQFAGRKIKCPKCAAAIVVAAAGPQTPAAPKPLKTAARIEADEPPPLSPAVPPLPRQPAASQEPLVPGGLEIPGLANVARSRGAPRLPPRRKSGLAANPGLWIGVGVGTGGLIAAVAIAVLLISRQTTSVAANDAGKPAEKTHTEEAPPPPAVPTATLILNWMESDRDGAQLFLDGQPVEVPKTGTVRLPLIVRAAQHQIRLVRKGYEPLVFFRACAASDDQTDYTPNWVPLAPDYHDWRQNFEEAKSLAREHSMAVLIVFDQSNASEESRRLAHVFSDRELRQNLDRDYVLVYIDLADSPEAKADVKDAASNRRLRDQFEISEYPTLVMTDADGQVLGFLGGFQEEGVGGAAIGPADHEEDEGEGSNELFVGGVKAFEVMFKEWRNTGEALHKAMEQVKSLTEGEEKHKAIGKLLDLLEVNNLERFYQPQIAQWTAMLPEALRKRPVAITHADCRRWLARFVRCLKKETVEESRKSLVQALAKFDEWKKEQGGRAFTDRIMGVSFLFRVVVLLETTQQYREAAERCEEAVALDPPIRYSEYLRLLHQGLLDRSSGFLGTGAGFCVADGGYIVTTRDVLRLHGKEAGRIMVRLPNRDKSIPARLIAADPRTEIALLQAELEPGAPLKPVSLAQKPTQGIRVCVLGFPDSANGRKNRDKADLTITAGMICALPGAEDKDPDMQSDCRVSPGSYGGPMCDEHGVVVGMVHRRTKPEAHGNVLFAFVAPCDLLRSFLKMHLPPAATLPTAQTKGPTRDWVDIKEQMSSSVVHILCLE